MPIGTKNRKNFREQISDFTQKGTDMKETHAELVERLMKPGTQILEEMTPLQAEFLHMAVLLVEESAEVLGPLKKHCIYQKPLDVDKLVDELGDLSFAMQALCTRLKVTREQIVEGNMEKLNARYPLGTYSNEQANNRS